jgi:hypothetical protein
MKQCNHQSETPGFAPCTRKHGHSGPCAHPPAFNPARDEEIEKLNAEIENEVREKSEAENYANRLAASFCPLSIRGEHSNSNNPWENAIDFAEELLVEASRCIYCKEKLESIDNDKGQHVCGKCRADIAESEDIHP